MFHRTTWVCFLVVLFLFLAVTPSHADDRIFENLRNQPSTVTDDTGARAKPDTTTRSDTVILRLDPILQVLPPFRSDTVFRVRPGGFGGTTPLARPPLRLILPPGESTRRPSRTQAPPDPEPAVRSRDDPAGIQYRRSARTANLTGPFNNRFFVGLRWPGVSLGFHEPPYTVEVKHLDDSSADVTVTGVRLYHHFLPLRRTNYYWGLDLSTINFEGEVSEGDGTSTGLYFGFYREVGPHLSWSLDMGPYYIYLRDDETRISADGLEYTVTTGLNVELW